MGYHHPESGERMLRDLMQTGRCTLGVVCALVGTGACSSTQMTPLGPVPAGVTVELQGSRT